MRSSNGWGHVRINQLRRRDFITLLGGAATASAMLGPLAARAQPSDRMRRIGVLMSAPENDPEFQGYVAAFRERLQKLGWTEGGNIQINTRWTTPDMASIQRTAEELVA